MNRVVPWAALVELVAPFAPQGKRGRPPFSVETMLRVYFMQQWFTLSNPAMEEALHDTPVLREFAGLDSRTSRRARSQSALRTSWDRLAQYLVRLNASTARARCNFLGKRWELL